MQVHNSVFLVSEKQEWKTVRKRKGLNLFRFISVLAIKMETGEGHCHTPPGAKCRKLNALVEAFDIFSKLSNIEFNKEINLKYNKIMSFKTNPN